MCITNKEEAIAKEDIQVYKVVTYNNQKGQLYTLFYSLNGLDLVDPIHKLLSRRDPGYKLYGLSCFHKLSIAQRYINELENFFKKPIHDFHDLFRIIKLKIPKGTKYKTGFIKDGNVGERLLTLSAERLEYTDELLVD